MHHHLLILEREGYLERGAAQSRAIRLTFIGKYFERIADSATNICEMVVYLVEGKVIKHAKKAGV